MRTLVWSSSFVRALKRKVSAQNPCSVLHHKRDSLAGFGPFQKLFLSRRQPDLRNQVEQTLC